jgi:acetyl esterase/lipase
MKQLLSCLSFVLCFLTVHAQEDTAKFKPVQLPKGYTSQIDVVYVKAGDWDGKMDIYLPAKTNKPTPVVINIHGGGWNHGEKESQTGFGNFFKRGYAVANVEYRLVQKAKAPAAIEDIRCALRYLIANAASLNVDVNKIVVMGGSAGGHLALMAGLLENDHRFDKNCGTEVNMKVAAIIDQYGIADVYDWGYGPNIRSKSAVNWLGDKAKDKDFAASVSPMSYVKKTSPPTFISHGDADPTVPYQQSVALYEKLKAAGVKTEFITVPGGLHGKFSKEDRDKVNAAINAFLTPLGL